jgi:CRP-like cAMP-binding protein
MNKPSVELKAQGLFPQKQNPVTFFPGEAWPQLARWAPAHVYPAGIELYRQGNPAQAVYLIEQGLVKLMCVEERGQLLTLGLRAPGWLLGARCAVLQKPYMVTAETLTQCYLYCIPADEFHQLVKTDLKVAWQLNQMNSWDSYERLSQLVGLVCLSARQRLENLLWELVAMLEPMEPSEPVRLRMPLKLCEIASMISVSPCYLSQLLSCLEQEGLIRRSKGWLMIPDPQRLWHWPEY